MRAIRNIFGHVGGGVDVIPTGNGYPNVEIVAFLEPVLGMGYDPRHVATWDMSSDQDMSRTGRRPGDMSWSAESIWTLRDCLGRPSGLVEQLDVARQQTLTLNGRVILTSG